MDKNRLISKKRAPKRNRKEAMQKLANADNYIVIVLHNEPLANGGNLETFYSMPEEHMHKLLKTIIKMDQINANPN